MKILLLSAYDATSHRYWRKGMQQIFPEHEWTVLTLPPRYFSWRIRGNSLSWAFEQGDILDRPYDLLIATSMTDLSALRGFVPALAALPTLVYFHENQFAYPQSKQQFSSLEPQVLNLYTALAADKLAFNSDYNRDTFLAGVDSLLKKMPDHVPANITQQLQDKSAVVAVPLQLDVCIQRTIDTSKPLKILWNHRWEYDKGPECLFRAVKQLLARGINMELYILGERFRQSPAIFDEMKIWFDQHYPETVKQWGFVKQRSDYDKVLKAADMVISTAQHEFQGLSVMEAVARGCIPVVPDRLSYPQWFEARYRYASFEGDMDKEATALADKIVAFSQQVPEGVDLSPLLWAQQKKHYQSLFDGTRLSAGFPVL